MRVRKPIEVGYANRALLTIVQVGVIERSELSQALYTETENGDMIPGVDNIGLVRADKRQKVNGYISSKNTRIRILM